jgi:leader peptidase (prepilin peptidase) / N-methyltransferase
LPHLFYILWLFTVGACVGSFLNVVVYRLPRGQSLVHPPSRCPNCEHRLAWYDNVPVVGWILLAGKCRYCRKPISARYPIIEAFTGSLFALFYIAIFLFHQGPFWAEFDDGGALFKISRMQDMATDWPIFSLYLFSVAAMLAVSLIDAEMYMVPPIVPLLMAAAGLLVHTIVDRPGLPGTLTADPAQMALATGGLLGLLLSIVLLRLGILPLSFADGQPPLEVEKLQRKPEDAELPDFTPAQVRSEISKEILFLMPPLILGGLTALLQKDGWPLHGLFASMSQFDWLSGLAGAVFGALVGGSVVWITRIFGSLAFGKEAMGLGDVDLMMGVGAVVGAGAATVAFLISPFFGLPLTLTMFLFRARRQLPFVPYLSMATAAVMLFYFPIYDYLRPGLIGLTNLLRELI